MLLIFGVTAGVFSADGVSAQAQNLPQNAWSRVTAPTSGAPTIFGFYSHGCLSGAQELPLDGVGYQVMRPSRHRYYGYPDTIQFVEELGKTLNALGSGILVGDMAQPRGGPLPYGHNSHQTGLDVDIWFWTHPEQRTRSLTTKERDTLPFVDMLNANGLVDSSKFTDEQILKLKTAAANPRVQRIFVNPIIKVYLCSILPPNDRSWLHTLRPWPGHTEHFHVRLKCPAGAENCAGQDEQPAGDGCSEVIPSPPAHEMTTEPGLPAECTKILAERHDN